MVIDRNEAGVAEASEAKQRFVAAVLWMGGALLSFAGMAIGIRAVGDTLGTFEILTFRSLIGLVIVGVVVSIQGREQIATRQPIRQVTRNVVHFGGQYLWTLGLTLLPLSVLTALEFTNPIWATLFAITMAGERFTKGRGLAVLCGFLGVLTILRPGLAVIDPASFLVLLAAALFAYAHISGKLLVRTDTPLAVVFYMALVQLPLAALPALFNWLWPAPGDYPWLCLIGFAGLSSHYCLSQAFKRADAMTVVPVDFLRLPLLTLVGILIYGERFDPFVVLGGGVICLGIYLNLREAAPTRSR
jgi:drug/metabolite transporter (DMT)-like permease